MELITQLIEILIWPATVLIIVFTFRSEILKIIPKLFVLKYKDFEMKFNNQLNAIEKKADDLNIFVTDDIAVSDDTSVKEETELERLLRISEFSPRAAIAESWIEVEKAVRTAARKSDLQIKNRESLKSIARALMSKGILNQNTFSIFNELRHFRNEAAHVPDFMLTHKESEKYIDLALRLANEINKI